MTIGQILKTKGSEVTTARTTHTLKEVAHLLDTQKIGAVVVLSDSGGLAGVLSERDIVRQVARQGAAALDMHVNDAMTREVVTGSLSDTVDAGLEAMTDRRIRHLPIVEAGNLVGLISIGDLVKQKIAQAEAEAAAMKDYIGAG